MIYTAGQVSIDATGALVGAGTPGVMVSFAVGVMVSYGRGVMVPYAVGVMDAPS